MIIRVVPFRKGTIFSLLLFLSHTIYAQKDSNRFLKPLVSINIGFGIPTNNFYMEELEGLYGGGSYGTIGYNINISGGIPIAHSHWGVTGLISCNAEPFDVNQCFLNLCVEGNSDVLNSSSYSDFKETLLMAGVFFSTHGKLRIDFKLLVGDNLSTTAGYSLTGTSTIMSNMNYSRYITASMQPETSSAMAFDFGISLWLIQKKHLFVLFSPDFMYSQTYINTIYDNSYPEHFRVNYNLLSTTVGVGYKL